MTHTPRCWRYPMRPQRPLECVERRPNPGGEISSLGAAMEIVVIACDDRDVDDVQPARPSIVDLVDEVAIAAHRHRGTDEDGREGASAGTIARDGLERGSPDLIHALQQRGAVLPKQ